MPQLTAAKSPVYGERAHDLLGALRSCGGTDFVGTPCGILSPVFALLTSDDRDDFAMVSREETAVAYAGGLSLTGRRPTVLMQNSGFGTCVNVLASLVMPYKLNLCLVVSLRGTDNDNTEENVGMGLVTQSVASDLGFPHQTLSGATDKIRPEILFRGGPSVLFVAPQYLGWSP